MADEVKVTEKMVAYRKAIYEEIEKIVNENREIIVERAVKKLQAQGVKVEK